MANTPFHLGWFIDGFRVPAWNRTWSGSSDYDWARTFYVDMARSLDRAKFDFMLFADGVSVKEAAGGSWEAPLKVGMTNLDPMSIAPILAWETTGIGIFPTASVSDWNPYLLARLLASIDQVSGGRIGWNMVTGGAEAAAENIGYELKSHDGRYEMAHEFAELVKQLWASWEPGSVVRNYDTDTYIDGTRVHRVDFAGQFFRSRGPLSAPPSPQRHPVLAQAGASPAGRAFAAAHADVIIGSVGGSVESMKEYRCDIDRRMTEIGRDPSEIRLFFMAAPCLAATQSEAEERNRLANSSPEGDRDVTHGLMSLSQHWGIDLTQLDLDAPLPPGLTTQGHQSELASMMASGRTLRQLTTGAGNGHMLPFVGTPDAVAAQMAEIQQEVGNDGFMFAHRWLDRKYIAEVTDGLVPALQRRGLVRREYESTRFRDNIFAF